ncbi:Uncharacterised protein [Salmonella enterica subsp. enterica serovar Bovismorbificans]|uniref:Uncharacterized protein n=1 Tax=Salmonella enterica subsp. enterica serovar Bovismorbificans TaxID=58097 RepID=A0A655EMQ0_SALET|nr:Uncharacterised protein [Salmonella enterica subsp. enterica serovar Bovismorbificans]
MFGDLFLQALFVFVQIKPDDTFARRHRRRYGAGFKFKHIFNQFVLLLAQDARQRAGFHHCVNIIRSNVVFPHHWNFEQAEDVVCHAVKQPHQRAKNEQAEAHRVDDTQSHSFWRNHTDAFRG